MKAKNSTHYFEVSDVITQFCAAFDSIIIGRFEKDKKDDDVRVQFRYAPKQRILHSLSNKAEHISLPIIAVSISGMTRDNDRVQNKIESHYYRQGSDIHDIPTPVPVNISVNMSIITRYQSDLDQILANFIPYTDPYIMISWKYPKEFGDFASELRSEVLWSGDINIDQPTDRGEAEKYRNVADTSFEIKAWLFKRHPKNPAKPIFEIDCNFIPISSLSNINLDYDDLDVETRSISAYPLITDVNDTRVIIDTLPIIKLEGDNFGYTTGIYLSSDSSSMFSEGLSSYDNFNGTLLSSSNYTIVNDNVLYVDLLKPTEEGDINIVIENDAGYVVSDTISSVYLSSL